MQVKVKKLDPEAIIPSYAKDGDSGFDLRSLEDVTVQPGETVLVRTGLSFEVPKGFELQVRPRSGMSLKTQLMVRNSPGTVDSGYRGEVGVICYALPMQKLVDEPGVGAKFQHIYAPVKIKKGDAIAQGVICPVVHAYLCEVEELSDSERGAGGFGSTGN